MKKFNFVIILMLAMGISAVAQNDDSGKRQPGRKQDSSMSNIQSQTSLAAQLQGSLDVKNSRVGDQVVLKTASAVKQNGKTIIPKGANVIGRITEVQQKSKNNAASKISVVFDRLQGKNLDTPITARIVSITQAAGNANLDGAGSADVIGSSSNSGSISGGGSGNGSGGGLLGGLGNTVGGVAGSATNTVGGITNTAGQTVGGATNAVGRTVSGIKISQSSDVSASGSTTLSSNNNNLKLEKGVTFNLLLSEQAGN